MLAHASAIQSLVFIVASTVLTVGCGQPTLYYETEGARLEDQLRDRPDHLFKRDDWLSLNRDKRNGWRFVAAMNPEAYREPEDVTVENQLRGAPESSHSEWLSLTRQERNQKRLMQVDQQRLRAAQSRQSTVIDELTSIETRAFQAHLDGTYERAGSKSEPPRMTGFILLAVFGGLWFLVQAWKPPPRDAPEAPAESAESPEQAKHRWVTTHRSYYWGGLVALYIYALLLVFQHEQILSFAGVAPIDSPDKITWPVLAVAQVTTWFFLFPLVIAVATSMATGCSNIVSLAVFLFLCVCQTILSGVFSGQERLSRVFVQMARIAVPTITFIVMIIRAIVDVTAR